MVGNICKLIILNGHKARYLVLQLVKLRLCHTVDLATFKGYFVQIILSILVKYQGLLWYAFTSSCV